MGQADNRPAVRGRPIEPTDESDDDANLISSPKKVKKCVHVSVVRQRGDRRTERERGREGGFLWLQSKMSLKRKPDSDDEDSEVVADDFFPSPRSTAVQVVFVEDPPIALDVGTFLQSSSSQAAPKKKRKMKMKPGGMENGEGDGSSDAGERPKKVRRKSKRGPCDETCPENCRKQHRVPADVEDSAGAAAADVGNDKKSKAAPKRLNTKACNHENCGRNARSTSIFCFTHGGGKRCAHPEGCEKSARGKSEFCSFHGGGRRCTHPLCTRIAQGKTDLCSAHGGGKRCQVNGCPTGARVPSVFCSTHGGGRRCSVDGCNKGARDLSGRCALHLHLKQGGGEGDDEGQAAEPTQPSDQPSASQPY